MGHEFTCVYTPVGNRGWRSIRFVVGEHGYRVKAERTLEPAEIAHFEALKALEKELDAAQK